MEAAQLLTQVSKHCMASCIRPLQRQRETSANSDSSIDPGGKPKSNTTLSDKKDASLCLNRCSLMCNFLDTTNLELSRVWFPSAPEEIQHTSSVQGNKIESECGRVPECQRVCVVTEEAQWQQLQRNRTQLSDPLWPRDDCFSRSSKHGCSG